MLIFLTGFFLIYALLHGYFYFRLNAAVALNGRWRAAVLLWLALMIPAPLLVRVLERADLHTPALLIAYSGYFWMGALFLFCVVALWLDIWRLLATGLVLLWRRLRAAIGPAMEPPVPVASRLGSLGSPRAIFLAAAIFALVASAYGYWEAQQIRLERLVITSDKLAPEQPPIRLVQISDVHLGLIVGPARLARMLEVVRRAEPDLLVSTGDLVDGQSDGLNGAAELFRRIEPRLGKYAVLGNHEFYVGMEHSLDFHRRAGFTVLRGEAATVVEGLVLAGVDDQTGIALGLTPADQEARLRASLAPENLNLLLKHQPRLAAGPGKVDLQLSGHVHQGQIAPFNLLVRLVHPVAMGLTLTGDGEYLYINRGAGTWGPPIRFLAPPEVTLIELRPAPAVP